MKHFVAAADVGNAITKMAYWQKGKIRTLAFKSRVKKGVASMSMLNDHQPSHDTFKLEGEVLTVLEDAMQPLNILKEGPDSLAVKALSLAGLNRIGLAGQDVFLATNLPLGKHVLKDAHGQMHFDEELQNKKMDRLRYNESDQCLSKGEIARIRKGVVFGEGFTAYIDSVVSDQGEIHEPIEKKRGVLDIGGGTTEIGIFSKNFQMDDDFITLNMGTNDVSHQLEKRILSRWPDFEKVEPVLLDRCLETGLFVDLEGRTQDISEEVKQCKEAVAREIIQEAKTRLKSNIDYLDQILLVGGGGQMLMDAFTQWHLITVPEDPVFANARGLLKVITFLSDLDANEVERDVPEEAV